MCRLESFAVFFDFFDCPLLFIYLFLRFDLTIMLVDVKRQLSTGEVAESWMVFLNSENSDLIPFSPADFSQDVHPGH